MSIHYRMEYDGWITALCQINTDQEAIICKDLYKITCGKCLNLLFAEKNIELLELDIDKLLEGLDSRLH